MLHISTRKKCTGLEDTHFILEMKVCKFTMASYAYGLDKMQYSTNLITYNDSERNTILDYSIDIIPLEEQDTIFHWLDIANYSVTGFQINLQRNTLKYLVNFYLPSGLFVVVSWVGELF